MQAPIAAADGTATVFPIRAARDLLNLFVGELVELLLGELENILGASALAYLCRLLLGNVFEIHSHLPPLVHPYSYCT